MPTLVSSVVRLISEEDNKFLESTLLLSQKSLHSLISLPNNSKTNKWSCSLLQLLFISFSPFLIHSNKLGWKYWPFMVVLFLLHSLVHGLNISKKNNSSKSKTKSTTQLSLFSEDNMVLRVRFSLENLLLVISLLSNKEILFQLIAFWLKKWISLLMNLSMRTQRMLKKNHLLSVNLKVITTVKKIIISKTQTIASLLDQWLCQEVVKLLYVLLVKIPH